MKFTLDTAHGADADGFRGEEAVIYEFENTEAERKQITEQLYDRFIEQCLGDKAEISFYCDLIGDDMEIIINTEDYIDDLIAMAKADEELRDDEDTKEWLRLIELKAKIRKGE